MKNKKKLVITALGLLLTVAIIVVVLVMNTIRSTVDDPLFQQEAGEAKSLTNDNARFLEQALSSSEKSEQAKALIPGLRDGEWSSNAVLPKGASLTIRQDTFVVDQDGYAQVDAVIDGSVSTVFIVGLVSIDGQWLIYATEQKG